MKKGFTLIELLAVIVILAIIALIATPIVMNTIEKSKKGAMERSAENYIDAVNTKIAESLLTDDKITDGIYDVNNIEVDITGSNPASGTIKITDSNVSDYILVYNKNIIEKDAINSSATTLDYTVVDYLKSTGTQYIDTNVLASSKIDTEITFLTNSYSKWIFGSRTSYSSSNIYATYISDYYLLWYQYKINSTQVSTVDNFKNKITSIRTKKNLFYVNDELKQTNDEVDFESNLPIYIFALNESGHPENRLFDGQIYSVKIYDDDILVRNMIPVIRNSDSKPGMYDLVNNQFYINKGTGEFIAG